MGRFQLHLSTALILMFLAGLLLWLNFIPLQQRDGVDGRGVDRYVIAGYGWPFLFRKYDPPRPFKKTHHSFCCYETSYESERVRTFDEVIALNLLVGMGALIGAALLIERRGYRQLAFWYGVCCGAMLSAEFIISTYRISTLPSASDVSLSNAFMPGWENWRPALVVFILTAIVAGLGQALQAEVHFPCRKRIG